MGYSLVMFAAGVGIPIMATLNSGLGTRLGSPVTAAAILFLLAAVLASLTYGGSLLAGEQLPPRAALTSTPLWLFAGGLFVVFYVFSITWLAPKLGVGNAVFLVLLGQLLATAFIDHYGWLGALQFKLTPQRILGLVLMGIGVYLARRPS